MRMKFIFHIPSNGITLDQFSKFDEKSRKKCFHVNLIRMSVFKKLNRCKSFKSIIRIFTLVFVTGSWFHPQGRTLDQFFYYFLLSEKGFFFKFFYGHLFRISLMKKSNRRRSSL